MIIRPIEVDFRDDRGTISDIFYKSRIDHVAVIRTNGGKRLIRGNHYHKLTTQHIFMSVGSLRYWYQPVSMEEPVRVVDVPEGYLVSTPPMEIHALEHLEASQFIVFSEGLRGGKDYEADTFRVDPILR